MTETLEHLRTPILLLALLAAGLQAGTYYTWASGVMPGLAHAEDRTFVDALQQINVSIVNPVFLASFLGAPLLAAVAVAAVPGPARAWAIAALVLAVGTVVVTGAANVPLNDALAAAGSVGDLADAGRLGAVRADFEDAWVRWNVVRTLTAAGALVTLAVAAIRN